MATLYLKKYYEHCKYYRSWKENAGSFLPAVIIFDMSRRPGSDSGEVLWWSVKSQGTVFHLTSGSSVSYLIRSGRVAQSSIELDLKISPPARGTSLFIAGEKFLYSDWLTRDFSFQNSEQAFLMFIGLETRACASVVFYLLTINYLKMVSRTSLFVLPSLYNYYK